MKITKLLLKTSSRDMNQITQHCSSSAKPAVQFNVCLYT